MEPGIIYPSTICTVGPTTTILVTDNPNRRGIIINNTDTPIYVGYGPYVSVAQYAYYLPPRSVAEEKDFRGTISAIAYRDTYVSITEVI